MTETVKLIQFRAAYNLPVHAGIEKGIFARHRLALETAYTPGSLYSSQALKDGEYDIGHTGADDVVAAVENDDGAALFIFMGLHSGLFTLVGAPDCPSIDTLTGRFIGVDAKHSGFVFVLERLLRSRNLTRDDYQLIEVGGWDSRFRALMAGNISATLLTEPFVLNALASGCHLLARDFEMIPSYQGTCGAASRSWAKQHPDVLVRYIRGYVEATQWCFDRANRSACLDLLARHSEVEGLAADATLNSLLDPAHGLYPDAAANLAGISAVLDLRVDFGGLTQPTPPVEKYVDLSYYRKALAIGA